jgi:hypothetical protein
VFLTEARELRTFFHASICAWFQMPGMFFWPVALSAMKTPSVMSSVPGVLARWE